MFEETNEHICMSTNRMVISNKMFTKCISKHAKCLTYNQDPPKRVLTPRMVL